MNTTDNNSSRSLLSLIEIFVAIGILIAVVTLTLQMFLLARFLGYKTNDTASAMFVAQNVAESIKLFNTVIDAEDFISTELSSSGGDHAVLYYDNYWNMTKSENFSFLMDVYIEREVCSGGCLYEFKIELYRSRAYPFIDNDRVQENPDYVPLLASIDAGKFVHD